jgi:transposase-like protein
VKETDWRQLAACLQTDPELFFPTAVAGPALAEQEAAAKAVCRGCPALAQCRRWAVAQLPHGIAGGLTEVERRALRAGETNSQTVAAPVNATTRERAAAGRAALRCGQTPVEVARQLGVSERTAQRWAAQVNHTADGSHGGNRAPVLISHSNTQAGTAMEGHRG